MLHQNPWHSTRVILPCLALLLAGAFATGCERQSADPAPSGGPPEVRVASLVPAVTNMLLGLGQGDMLVAVSNYDTDPRVEALPRVGDLLTVDWEQIAAANPTHMVVQTSREQTPPGAIERAQELGIELVHVKIVRLSDISRTLTELEGTLTGRVEDASWANVFRQHLEHAQPFRPPERHVPTLLALSPDLSFVAGRRNYLDDLLHHAGGVNVVAGDMADYPRLDREMLLSLRPERIVLILPDATDAQLAEARGAVDSLAPHWGLSWEDVILVTDPYAMVPGWSVIDLSQRLTDGLSAPR